MNFDLLMMGIQYKRRNGDMEKTMNLKNIIEEIQREEILLPDFQRGFVWKKEEMQKKLAASILTKMPIGSILLLEADADEYGCKMIGRKTRVEPKGMQGKNIKILLDGQQRITVLTNIFSNVIFEGLKNYRDELASSELKKRFFIRIPKSLKEGEEDIWGISKLCFPVVNPESSVPSFLSDAAYYTIEALCFNRNEDVAYHPQKFNGAKLQEFCCHGDEKAYRIPLFLLVDHSQESKYKNCFKRILKEILKLEILRRKYEFEDSSNKEEYIKEHLAPEYKQCCLEQCSDMDEFGKILEDNGECLWVDRIEAYLSSCITGMELMQICVPKADRTRAIDIYENLNLGGVTLSTFELVLAKASKLDSQDHTKNLFEKICEYIKKEKEYELEQIPEAMYNCYESYVNKMKTQGGYSASEHIGCYDEKKNLLNKKYTDAFLNILSLYCYNPHYQAEEVKVEYIKRNKILELNAQQINNHYEQVCVGLDRACLFLQMRCGMKDINDLNYSLMLVLLGYLFTCDTYYRDRKLRNRLEAWYWSTLFSGALDTDQNITIIEHLKFILKEDMSFIVEMKEKMFHKHNDFSSKETLLMEKKNYLPKTVIRDGFCQFYLMQTYEDLCEPHAVLSTLYEDAKSLQKHHILPLGSDLEQYGKTTKKLRKKQDSIYHSPLNFVYITPEANKMISCRSIGDYKRICKDTSYFKLNMDVMEPDWTKENDIKKQLEYRFQKVSCEIKEHVENKLK